MTKTQISVRVSPDTLAAIDAAAQAASTSRGHVIDRWLTDAAVRNAPSRRRGVEETLLMAAEAMARAGYEATDTNVLVALDRIISACRLMAGID